MKVSVMKLADLKRPEKNCRIHTDRQLKEFKRSVEMFGQIRPIVVDETNTILCGNGLYEALLEMGKTEASVLKRTDLTDAQKKKLMLADNKVFTLGTDNLAVFDEWLRELGDADIPGYDEELLETLLSETTEIDELVTDYGNFTESSVNSMRRNEEAHAAGSFGSSAAPAAQSEETPIRNQNPQETPSEGSYVVCPNCGHHIPVR